MNNTYLPIHLEAPQTSLKNQSNGNKVSPSNEVVNRRRSNSQSQVISTPTTQIRPKEIPHKRNKVLYFVTLTPLNDTFVKKHLLVPYFPETRKLGRPAGSKVKPDITNGFFDSRVLSRSHAAMFIGVNGKLMLKDLGSSNGTYINEERIGADPVEIKIGDVIYLGFNIQADTNHKQISAKVENINIMQNFYTSSPAITTSLDVKNQHTMDTPEFKHYNFIQDIISKIPNSKDGTNESKEIDLSFDNALFGDINPNIEDTLLGLNNNGNCGIFNNAQITTASSMDNAIKVLRINLLKIKQQNNTLVTLEEFLTNYQSRLNELNSNFLKNELESKALDIEKQIEEEKSLTQKTKDKHKAYKTETSQMMDQLRQEISVLMDEKESLNKRINEMDGGLKMAESGISAAHDEEIDIDDLDDYHFTSSNTNNSNEKYRGTNGTCEINEVDKNRAPKNEEQRITPQSPGVEGSEYFSKDQKDKDSHDSNVHNTTSPISTSFTDKAKSSEKGESNLTPPLSDGEMESSRSFANTTTAIRKQKLETVQDDVLVNEVNNKMEYSEMTELPDLSNQRVIIVLSIIILGYILRKLVG